MGEGCPPCLSDQNHLGSLREGQEFGRENPTPILHRFFVWPWQIIWLGPSLMDFSNIAFGFLDENGVGDGLIVGVVRLMHSIARISG